MIAQTTRLGEYLWQMKYHLAQAFEQDSQGFVDWLEWFYQGEGIVENDDGTLGDSEAELIDTKGGMWRRSRTSGQQLRQAVYLGRYLGEDDEWRPVRPGMKLLIIEQNPNKQGRSEGARYLAEGYDVAQIIIDIRDPNTGRTIWNEYWGMLVARGDQCQLHFYRGKGLNDKE